MTALTERAEIAGEAVGRAYARTTAALAEPIRRAPAPKWPRERVRSGVVAAQRRVRNIPRRLLNGLRALLTRKRPDGKRLFKTQKRPVKTRIGQVIGASFVAWWGWSWAADAGALPWVYSVAAATAASVAYAVGDEPETPSSRRIFRKREKGPGTALEVAPEDSGQEPEADPLLALCAQLTGTARGVHLDALCAALNKASPDRERTPSEVRAALAQRGVVTRPSVGAPEGAVPGAPRKVRRGVHREDLEAVIGPLPGPTPMDPAVGVATAVAPVPTCDAAETLQAVGSPVAAPVESRESA